MYNYYTLVTYRTEPIELSALVPVAQTHLVFLVKPEENLKSIPAKLRDVPKTITQEVIGTMYSSHMLIVLNNVFIFRTKKCGPKSLWVHKEIVHEFHYRNLYDVDIRLSPNFSRSSLSLAHAQHVGGIL